MRRVVSCYTPFALPLPYIQLSSSGAGRGKRGKLPPLWVDVQKLCNMCVCVFIVMEILRITRQIHCKAVEQRATLIHRQYNRDRGNSYSRPYRPIPHSPPLLQNPGGATVKQYATPTPPPAGKRSVAISSSVCVSVCVCVCPRAYLRYYTSNFHPIFLACYLRPWLGPPPAALRYVMYLGFFE